MGAGVWQIWLTAVITLGIYTFLYNDNRLYRFLLSIMIGLGVGYSLVLTWLQVLGPLWWDKAWKGFSAAAIQDASLIARLVAWVSSLSHHIGGHPWSILYWLVLGLLGTLWYFQFSRKNVWLSRIVIGMTLGAGAGVTFKNQLLLNAPQITDSFRAIPARGDGTPLVGGTGPVEFLPSLVASLNNIIFVGTIVCVMVYFFFSFSHDSAAIRKTANLGRWVLMFSFGAFFGNSVMTRMAIFLERVQFLVNDWGRNPRAWTWQWILGAIGLIVVLAVIYLLTPPRPKPPTPEEAAE